MPPFPWDDLEIGAQDENQWLSQHVHGLGWENGDVPASKFNSILEEYTGGASTIYTFGHQQTTFLTDVLGRQVLDLQELQCPRYNLLISPYHISCAHPLHRLQSVECALRSALVYGYYLTHFDLKSTLLPDVQRRRSDSF